MIVATLAMVEVELADKDLGHVALGSMVVDVGVAEERMLAGVEVVMWADMFELLDFD